MAFLNGEIRTFVFNRPLSFSESGKLNNTHRKKRVFVLVCRRFHFLEPSMEGRYMPKNNSRLTTTQARGRKGYVSLLANYYPMTSYVLLIMADIWFVCQTRR